jgi:hypothetical protein
MAGTLLSYACAIVFSERQWTVRRDRRCWRPKAATATTTTFRGLSPAANRKMLGSHNKNKSGQPQPEEDTIAGFLDNHFGSMVCDPKKHRTCQLKARTLEHAMLPTPAIMHTPFPLASSTAS